MHNVLGKDRTDMLKMTKHDFLIRISFDRYIYKSPSTFTLHSIQSIVTFHAVFHLVHILVSPAIVALVTVVGLVLVMVALELVEA